MKLKAIAFIFAVALIIYSNSLGGDFLFDDDYFVVKNLSIRSLDNTLSFFTNPGAIAFSELSRDVYRPITALSYAIDYSLGRFNTLNYHLTNVLFHSFNAALLFLFIYALFGDIFTAFSASLLFLCHPVNTEVVSWISGRSSVLFLFFYLLALLAYVYYGKCGSKRYLLYSIIAYSFSLFSKEMAVSLPLILVVYDIHFSRGEKILKRALKYAPFLLMTAVFIAARSLVIKRVSQCDWWGGTPYHNFLSMTVVIWEYVKILLYPKDLCAFYTNKIYMSIAHTEVLVSISGLALLAAAMPSIFKRSRALSFCVSWFFITLLPVLNIVPIRALMAERFLYIPSIGFCLALAIILKKSLRNARLTAAIVALIVIAYSFRTVERNYDWKDAVTISKSIIKVSPVNPWAYTSLGSAYIGDGRYMEGEKELRKAMALSRYYDSPRKILGHCYLDMGRYKEAVDVLQEAQKMDPGNIETMNSLGVALANLKRYDEAIKQFENSQKIDPSFISAYLNMGAAYEFMKEYEKALFQYEKTLALTKSRQDLAVTYIRIGDLYIKKNDIKKAESYYNKAIDMCGRGFDDLKKVATDRLNAKWDIK